MIQPTVFGLGQRWPLNVGDGVEDTGQPVADETERGHEQE